MTRTVDDVIADLEFQARYREDRDAPDNETVRVIVAAIAEITRLRAEREQLRADNALLAGAVRVWEPVETSPAGGSSDLLVWQKEGHPRTACRMTSVEDGDVAWVIARRTGSDAIAFVYADPTHFQCLPDPPDPDRDAAVREAIGRAKA